MSVVWSEFRDIVRLTVLKDTNVDALRYTDSQLLTFANWATDTLCFHTAATVEQVFTDFLGTDLVLTEEPFDNVETTAQIFVGDSTEPLDPMDYTRGYTRSTPGVFYEYPLGTIKLTTEITTATDITVRYFGYYNKVVDDLSVLNIPKWAEMPIAYLIGSHCMASYSMGRAQLSQWAEAPDKGGPEDNPFRVQQKWFMEMFEREIARRPAQERINHYREI